MQVFLTPTHLAIAMEYAQGGDLFNYVLGTTQKRLGENEARWIFQQLVIALDYCHRRVSLESTHFLVTGKKCGQDVSCTGQSAPELAG